MRPCLSSGAFSSGKVVGYPSQQLSEEVACIAYHFHWPLDSILALPNFERRRWVGEIGKIRQTGGVLAQLGDR